MKFCNTCGHWKPSQTARNQAEWGDCEYLKPTNRDQEPYLFDIDYNCLCGEIDEDKTDIETAGAFGCVFHTDKQLSKDLYRFREFYIPKRMMPGIRRYIEDHVRPGDFLCAVIQNNLQNAYSLADEENQRNLPAYIKYFYNEAPAPCHGSAKRLGEWLKLKPKA